ncbi:hypothetical protein [Tatumella punctata]|uniref:Uncharacterized protein n=1 Tax=Tatumella punctata TaxID=399969 RepID=A0ABW1VVG7_9GAMM
MKMKIEEQYAILAQGIVAQLYKDGKTPMHAYGTSWEQMSKVERENPKIFEKQDHDDLKTAYA